MSLLEVDKLVTAYGAVVVNREASFRVDEHEIVTILGSNGAGKTTILRAIAGLIKPRRGTIHFDGKDVTGIPADRMAGMGVVMVPEGRRIFPDLTVEENLRLGAYSRQDHGQVEQDLQRMENYFQILQEKRKAKGSELSGGQQQMLAIARGLMAKPRILLLDEPTLGLAPVMVRQLSSVIGDVRKQFGATVVLVEQNAGLALEVAERGYLMQRGQIVASGDIADLRDHELMHELYLGKASVVAASPAP